jgi:tRNA(fMet)-specific endonuclease VapC
VALIVDTSVFVEAERRGADLSEIVTLVPDDESLAVPAIVIAELLVGVHLGQPESRRREREEFIARISSQFPVLSFDVGVAAVYSELWATLRRAGGLIPPHDLMIGATALHYGAELLTHNLRDFQRIPGVQTREPGW